MKKLTEELLENKKKFLQRVRSDRAELFLNELDEVNKLIEYVGLNAIRRVSKMEMQKIFLHRDEYDVTDVEKIGCFVAIVKTTPDPFECNDYYYVYIAHEIQDFGSLFFE